MAWPHHGADVVPWILKNYKGVVIIGGEPLRDRSFGLEFFKRSVPAAGVSVLTPDH
jgi:hypothetical protein